MYCEQIVRGISSNDKNIYSALILLEALGWKKNISTQIYLTAILKGYDSINKQQFETIFVFFLAIFFFFNLKHLCNEMILFQYKMKALH